MKTITKLFALAAIVLGSAFAASAQLPSIQVKDLAGKPVDTATLNNEGKPYIITFWATWCKPCLRELKAFAEIYDDLRDETGVKIYAISIDEAQNVAKVKPLVDRMGWEYEVLVDSNSDFMRAMGGQNPPHLVVVDGDGKIVESHSGYTDGSEDHVAEMIRQLVSK